MFELLEENIGTGILYVHFQNASPGCWVFIYLRAYLKLKPDQHDDDTLRRREAEKNNVKIEVKELLP